MKRGRGGTTRESAENVARFIRAGAHQDWRFEAESFSARTETVRWSGMNPSASFRIKKSTTDIEVRDLRGNERHVTVYVTEASVLDGREERLQDVFQARRFIPVREGATVELISTKHVSWLKLDLINALDELDPEAENGDGAVSCLVRVELEDGAVVEGLVRYLMPANRRRLVDYLDSIPRWLPLRTPDWLYLINRDCVIRATPKDEV